MIAKIVNLGALEKAGRWRVEIFTDVLSKVATDWPLIPLRDLVQDAKQAVEPSEYDQDEFVYMGLENVESVTGEAVGVQVRNKAFVKSRSKVFTSGQILYGRLRPYLRKAYLAAPPFGNGLCSTEFLVLEVNSEIVIPQVLRALLVSQYATDQFTRFQVGAALPRVSARDFLAVKLPIPPMAFQRKWMAELDFVMDDYRKAKRRVEEFPVRFGDCLERLIEPQEET